jgi:hypothetical protein
MADRLETRVWPTYDVGPRESVFALGVASVNYARLEFAFGSVFAKVLEVTNDQAFEELAKTRNNHRCLHRMRDALQKLNWPDDTKDRITHFMEAFKILADNRNLLDHSAMFAGLEAPTGLYKSDNKGNTIHTAITLVKLRQVGDDMMRYYNYGLVLGNSIGPAGEINGPFPKILPGKPPLPKRLSYTSRPLPLTRYEPSNIG